MATSGQAHHEADADVEGGAMDEVELGVCEAEHEKAEEGHAGDTVSPSISEKMHVKRF